MAGSTKSYHLFHNGKARYKKVKKAKKGRGPLVDDMEMAVQEAEAELGEDHGKTIVPVIITYKKKRKNFFNWYNLN